MRGGTGESSRRKSAETVSVDRLSAEARASHGPAAALVSQRRSSRAAALGAVDPVSCFVTGGIVIWAHESSGEYLDRRP